MTNTKTSKRCDECGEVSAAVRFVDDAFQCCNACPCCVPLSKGGRKAMLKLGRELAAHGLHVQAAEAFAAVGVSYVPAASLEAN